MQQTSRDPFRATLNDKQGSTANATASVRNACELVFPGIRSLRSAPQWASQGENAVRFPSPALYRSPPVTLSPPGHTATRCEWMSRLGVAPLAVVPPPCRSVPVDATRSHLPPLKTALHEGAGSTCSALAARSRTGRVRRRPEGMKSRRPVGRQPTSVSRMATFFVFMGCNSWDVPLIGHFWSDTKTAVAGAR